MKNLIGSLKNQNGSVIVVAMVMLALLTLLGIASSKTSTTGEALSVAKQYNEIEFYIAESGWKQGAMWLENKAGPPDWVNSNDSDDVVKNYGYNTLKDSDTSNLKNITPDNNSLSYYQIPYWYGIEHLDSSFLREGEA